MALKFAILSNLILFHARSFISFDVISEILFLINRVITLEKKFCERHFLNQTSSIFQAWNDSTYLWFDENWSPSQSGNNSISVKFGLLWMVIAKVMIKQNFFFEQMPCFTFHFVLKDKPKIIYISSVKTPVMILLLITITKIYRCYCDK